LQIAQSNFLTGGIELRPQKILRRLNECVELLVVVRYTGDALIRLDTDEQRSSIGIGHARKHPHDLSSQLFLALFLTRRSTIFVGADKFEKLAAVLLEEKSDFLCLHASTGEA